MSILHPIKLVIGHPLNRNHKLESIWQFLKWHFVLQVSPGPVVFNWIGGSRFIVRKDEYSLTGNIYCGLLEFPDMAFLLHTLSEDDLFVDIGANAGSYTLLAYAARRAKSICFEPVPDTHKRLMDNIRLNDLCERVTVFNIGLSYEEGELIFTADRQRTGRNHVLAEGEAVKDSVRVVVRTLDSILNDEAPTVIKIDVEGYEQNVLLGMAKCLGNRTLNSVIMETNESGARYGFNDADLVLKMREYDFYPYSYEPFSRTLQKLERGNGSGNTLFIRDVESVKDKIAKAPRIQINKETI